MRRIRRRGLRLLRVGGVLGNARVVLVTVVLLLGFLQLLQLLRSLRYLMLNLEINIILEFSLK